MIFIQAAKIINTGLARTGLRIADVKIGTQKKEAFSTTSVKYAEPNTTFLATLTTVMPPEMQTFFVISVGLSSILLGYWFIPLTEVISEIYFTDSRVEQASQFTSEVSRYQGLINQVNIDAGVSGLWLYWEFIINYIEILDINFDNWSQGALRSLLDQLWTLHVTHEALYEALQRFTGFMDGTGFDLVNPDNFIQDFRNVGNTILRTVRRIEAILNIQDSRIIRQWNELQ